MLEKLNENIEKAISHLNLEYSKLQLGRANPALVEGIMVDQYGSLQPLQNMASVSNLDSQTISIKPWDKGSLHDISKAITDSSLGLNPQDT
jgi:ribosome recycling factor